MALREEMCYPPTGDEVEADSGSNGLLPDIVVACCWILLCHCLVQCEGEMDIVMQL